MPPKPYLAPRFYPPVPADPTARVRPVAGYYQVREYTCGFASTLMVLHTFQRPNTAREVYEELGTNYTGTSQSAIVRVLRRGGLSANIRYDLDFERLAGVIDSGKLVIGYHHRLEHWVVIHGYGLDPERVFVADPIRRRRSEQRWSKYGAKLGGFGIVCSPRRRRGTSSIPIEQSSQLSA